jgi:2-phospho-L-lactate guanylyltransferase
VTWVCVVPVKGSAGAKSRLGELPETFPARGELAEAFALDTVAALLATTMVERVLVVTADPAAAAPLQALGAQIVPEPPRPSPSDAPNAADAWSSAEAWFPAEAWSPVDARSLADAWFSTDAPSPSAAVNAADAPHGRTAAPRDPLNAAIGAGIRVAQEQYPLCNVAVLTGDLPALTVADVERTLTAATGHDRAMVADEEGTGTTTLLARAGLAVTPRFGPGSRAAHEADGHHPLDLPATLSIRRDVDTVADLVEALRRGVGEHTSALIASSQLRPGDP